MPVGHLQPIDSIRPFDLVGIDFVGPFNSTERGNQYICTIIDHFTGWTELRAVPGRLRRPPLNI